MEEKNKNLIIIKDEEDEEDYIMECLTDESIDNNLDNYKTDLERCYTEEIYAECEE